MTEESGVGHLQTLKLAARATSKFKVLEPTKLQDLLKHAPGQYKPLEASALDHLSEGDLVKIAFIHNEDLWIVVDSVDSNTNAKGEETGIGKLAVTILPVLGTMYGKTCQQVLKLHGLQKGQRVCFDLKCVCEIKYQGSDSDEDSD